MCFFDDKKEKIEGKNYLLAQRSKESLFTAVGSHSGSLREMEREIRGALMGQKTLSSQNLEPEKKGNIGKVYHGSDKSLLK